MKLPYEARTSAVLAAALDCVITMDSHGQVVDFNPSSERTFGYTREYAVGRPLAELIIPPSLRERHREGLARYLATGQAKIIGRRIELPAMRADGTEFPVELAITRVQGEGPPVFTAYLRDITQRVRTEHLRRVRLAATEALAQAADVPDAARSIIGAVCEQLGWDFGAFWGVDRESQTLQCVETRVADGSLAEFDVATRTLRFRRGEGFPGRVWAISQATWSLDVGKEENFPRAAEAKAVGLRSAFGCPIKLGEHTLGVLEFFTRVLREPDADLLETMGTLCGQVAHFIERRQAEERLRESEARFRALMDQAPFSMQILAPDGRTVRVNPAWCNLWGVMLDQLSGYNMLSDPQLERKGVLPYLRRAFAGEAVSIPVIRYDPNETIPDKSKHSDPSRHVAAVAYPVKDDSGRVKEVVLVHEDITARHVAENALRESEEKLRLLVDTIPQPAWMAEPDGYISWYNRRWYEYTGTAPDQMEGWGWQAVHDPAALPEVVERWKFSIESGQPFEMVFPLRGADGTFRSFLTRVNPLRGANGQILYWFGTNTDISDIKRMEEALRESDRKKDEFLATLAHELRNPLSPIANALQLLNKPGVSAHTAQRAREIMERQVNHLVRLVDDLLDMSRVARGKIDLRPEVVEIADVLEAAVESVEPLISERKHALKVSIAKESITVKGDAVRLCQVFANVLTNAAKYTEAHGDIRLSARREGADAVVCVEDNGIGIPPELIGNLFEPFVQGNQSAARTYGGLGIGLTLARSLLELHGGGIKVDSEGLGKGARFTVRLPLSSTPSKSNSLEARPTEAHVQQQNILVVDDNKDAADSLAALLRTDSHNVRVAYDGGAALKAAIAERPKFIFLDIGMPGIDGYETARRLRTISGMEKAKIVALTGWGQEKDRMRSAAAGFDHHLVKPPDPNELRRILRGS